MAIRFGSEEAREVLLRDRQRRYSGALYEHKQKDADGTLLLGPTHYVAATWEADPVSDEDEDWDDFDESGDLEPKRAIDTLSA